MKPNNLTATFYQAFNFFNKELFKGSLGMVVITVSRKTNCHGFYWAGVFKSPDGPVSEISLNPDLFILGDEEVLSTLVHEMVHHWQYTTEGVMPKGHNAKWSKKMIQIGLIPSHNGKPGGAKTGMTMSHYIEKEGPFKAAYEKWKTLNSEVKFDLVSLPKKAEKKETKKPKKKIRKKCPKCDLSLSIEPHQRLKCLNCEKELTDGKN